ncbi:MAG: family 16 glycoside hydrolase [Bryobacteraceae bacterium]
MSASSFLLCGALAAAFLSAAEIPLKDLSRLDFENASPEETSYKGKSALKMTEKQGNGPSGGGAMAIIKGLTFRDGVIEVDVAGAPIQGATPTARGFIGIVFRIQPDGKHFENIYLRPTNGRSPDQAMRNHSVQYIAGPDWGWRKLREQEPFKYESYTDLRTGEWTHMRIVVQGKTASLYVDDAKQPCLVVQDMKNGDSEGAVALWSGPETEGYFRNLKITPGATP